MEQPLPLYDRRKRAYEADGDSDLLVESLSQKMKFSPLPSENDRVENNRINYFPAASKGGCNNSPLFGAGSSPANNSCGGLDLGPVTESSPRKQKCRDFCDSSSSQTGDPEHGLGLGLGLETHRAKHCRRSSTPPHEDSLGRDVTVIDRSLLPKSLARRVVEARIKAQTDIGKGTGSCTAVDVGSGGESSSSSSSNIDRGSAPPPVYQLTYDAGFSSATAGSGVDFLNSLSNYHTSTPVLVPVGNIQVRPPLPVNPFGMDAAGPIANTERALVPYTGRAMPEPSVLARNAVIINTNSDRGNYVVLTSTGRLAPMEDRTSCPSNDIDPGDSDTMVDDESAGGNSGGINSEMMEMLASSDAPSAPPIVSNPITTGDADNNGDGMDTC